MKITMDRILRISNRFTTFIIGSRDELSLEKRLMNLVSFVGLTGAVLASIFNFAIGLPFINTIQTLIVSLIFIPIYYLIRFRKKHKYYYGIQLFIILVILISEFFYNWGFRSGMSLYFVIFTTLIPVYPNNKFKNILYILSILSISTLFYIDFFYPQLILNTFENERQRILDIYIGVYFAIFTIQYIIRSLINNYKYEREKVVKQSQRIEQMRDQEKKEYTSKINFFTNISHELRTPLSLIMAPLENLMENDNNKIRNAQYKLISENAKKLNELVDQILDFRKLETGAMQINPQKVDVVDFLRTITSSYSPLAERNQTNLFFTINISKTYVNIDLEKVERAISNILNNAFKFTQAGGIIEVILDKKKENPQNVLIEIKDNGVGFHPDLTESIFQPFYQSPEAKQGTGLGLAIALEIIKKHNGNITAKSLKKGASFIIEIPTYDNLKTTATSSSTKKIYKNSDNNFDELKTNQQDNRIISSTNHYSLLIIDDNKGIIDFLSDTLSEDYKIITAFNGNDGMSQTLTKMPDLIISDIMMPEMDGLEFCKQLKSNRLTSHIPIILLTAKSDDEDKLEGLEIGADEYISKPFNIKVLKSRINNLIENRKLLQSRYKNEIFSIMHRDSSPISADERFIIKATQIAKSNIHKHDFGVSEFVEEIGISRSSLHTKLKHLTKLSTSRAFSFKR